jgi:hypothetical protein
VRTRHPLAKSARPKIPGGITAHGLSGFEPVPFGLAIEVTVNFTIPGTMFRQKISVKKGFTLSL